MSSLKLSRLNVSLTKHGAHKIALLLRKYSKDEVLGRADGKEPGINIDVAQARKNLSVGPGDRVPAVWNRVRPLGPSAIDALVLIAIIFSHHELMAAMAQGRSAKPGHPQFPRSRTHAPQHAQSGGSHVSDLDANPSGSEDADWISAATG